MHQKGGQDGEQVVRRVDHQPVGLGAVFHRHLLDGLVFVQRGQDVEALEHPVHQQARLVGGGVVVSGVFVELEGRERVFDEGNVLL